MRKLSVFKLVVCFGIVMAVVLPSCGEKEEGSSQDYSSLSDSEKVGKELYGSQNCKLCHGESGQGDPKLGPSILSIQDRWDREKLAEYILDAAAYASKHLDYEPLPGEYKMPMQAFKGLTLEQRLSVADYVLNLKK